MSALSKSEMQTPSLRSRSIRIRSFAVTNLFVPRREQKYAVTAKDLMRILRDRKDGVCISDFESALIGRILVCRAKGRFITSDELIDAVRDSE